MLAQSGVDPSTSSCMPEAWARVFAIAAAVSLFGAVVFLALASAEQVDFEDRGEGNVQHEAPSTRPRKLPTTALQSPGPNSTPAAIAGT